MGKQLIYYNETLNLVITCHFCVPPGMWSRGTREVNR